MKKVLAALTLGTLTLAAEPNSSQAVLKHREHNGIGYQTGYTTAEVFLAPKWKNNLLPFMDLRGHVFDNGKFATNAGIGLRYNWSTMTLGGNFYYDFREASNLNPHQLAGGLEFLWKYLDVRVNGYGPIANTKFENTPKFIKFSGNSAIFDRRLKAALPMIEGEIGVPFGKRCGDWNLYGALGPYYLFKKTVNGLDLGKAWGGQGRVELNLVDRYKMTALATYDEIFKWTVQGAFAVSLPFRKRSETQNPLCAARNQLPYRQEIIPIQCENVRTIPPFNIVFVNNTSSSNGTAESPYPTLALAQANSAPGDVIYVFLGDGTATGMSSGITLQNRQRFHGSGAPMDLDGFVVPALTFNRPTIRNTAGNAVRLANNNTVAGFNIVSSTGNGIDNTGVSGGSYIIAYNSINAVGTAINLESSINGQAFITGNHIFNTVDGGILITSTGSAKYQPITTHNTIENLSGNASISYQSLNSSQLGGLIGSNTVNNNSDSFGIYCQSRNDSAFNAIVKGNVSAPNNAVGARSALNCSAFNSSIQFYEVKGNQFFASAPAVYIEPQGSPVARGIIENNRIFNPTSGSTIEIFCQTNAELDLTLRRNFISNTNNNGNSIFLNPTGGPSPIIIALNIENNILHSPTGVAFGLNNSAGGMQTLNVLENRCISNNSNHFSNHNGGLMVVNTFANIFTTNNPTSLEYQNVDASTLTCTNILGNQANGALSLSATAPASLQVESSTATKQGVLDDNTFPGGVTTTGNVTFVNFGTCP